jgi:RNA recognition motif-containing protein
MSKKVFIGGLPWEAEASDLEVHFSVFGPIESTNVIKDRETGKSRGFGFVTFVEEEGAKAACKAGSIEIEAGGRCRTVKIDMASEKGTAPPRRNPTPTPRPASPTSPVFAPESETPRFSKPKKKGRKQERKQERSKEEDFYDSKPKQRRGRRKQSSWEDSDWE